MFALCKYLLQLKIDKTNLKFNLKSSAEGFQDHLIFRVNTVLWTNKRASEGQENKMRAGKEVRGQTTAVKSQGGNKKPALEKEESTVFTNKLWKFTVCNCTKLYLANPLAQCKNTEECNRVTVNIKI